MPNTQTSKDGPEHSYTVDFDVYRVCDRIETVNDKNWWEYKVRLLDNGDVVDSWDSRLATYNGKESQRLNKSSAIEAAKRVKQEVEGSGSVSGYFEVES